MTGITRNTSDLPEPGFDESYEHLLSGPDCCAADSVSFHYVEGPEARALFRVREALLTNPHVTDHELKAMLMATWPDRSQVSFYSRGLPEKEADWVALMATLRKISTRATQADC